MNFSKIPGRYKLWTLILLPIYLWAWYMYIPLFNIVFLSKSTTKDSISVLALVFFMLWSLIHVAGITPSCIYFFNYIFPKINKWADEKL